VRSVNTNDAISLVRFKCLLVMIFDQNIILVCITCPLDLNIDLDPELNFEFMKTLALSRLKLECD